MEDPNVEDPDVEDPSAQQQGAPARPVAEQVADNADRDLMVEEDAVADDAQGSERAGRDEAEPHALAEGGREDERGGAEGHQGVGPGAAGGEVERAFEAEGDDERRRGHGEANRGEAADPGRVG